MGWSLNAGGAITRVVKGMPDELSSINYSGFFTEQSNLDLFFDGDGGFTQEESEDYVLEVAKNMRDTEADVFFYNFTGKSGFFTLDGHGGFTTFPDVNLKIEYTNSLFTFTLTDEEGIKYTFNYREETEKMQEDSEPEKGQFLDS